MARAAKPVVLITGVSGGIGAATAMLFAERGWIVVGTLRTKAGAAALRGSKIELKLADMLKAHDLERVVQSVWRTHGRLDALICNAGYGLVGPIDTLGYAQMNEQLTVNTLAPAELIRQAVPIMKKQASGVIIGVSSVAGRVGAANYSLYNASKFALEGLLESLAMELASSNIRVRLIEPSGVNTGFWTGLRRGKARLRPAAGPRKAEAEVYGVRGRYSLTADAVARAIYTAVMAPGSKLRYPLGHTRYLSIARRLLPERVLLRIMRRIVTNT